MISFCIQLLMTASGVEGAWRALSNVTVVQL